MRDRKVRENTIKDCGYFEGQDVWENLTRADSKRRVG
jgi:hypothetical protein